MSLFDLFSSFLSLLFIQLPVILLWFAGIYASLTMRDRNPEVSHRCLIAFAIFLITAFLSPLVSLLPIYLTNFDWSIVQTSLTLGIISFAMSIARAIGWGLILHAIFSQFPPAAKEPNPFN